MNKNSQVYEDIRKLVLARIKAMPKELKISIGSSDYTKDQILKSTEENNELGQQVMNVHMDFIRSMASGSLYEDGQQKDTSHKTQS